MGATFRALVPYFEPRFLDSSYGFRTGARAWQAPGEKTQHETFNTWRLLADLELAVNEERRCVLVIDDVRKAFDNVNIDLLPPPPSMARKAPSRPLEPSRPPKEGPGPPCRAEAILEPPGTIR